MEWQVGLTTVPERRYAELPSTLRSLRHGGFTGIRLFVDGDCSESDYASLGLQCTFRKPRIRTWGNWWLGFQELFIRNPNADRYIMFQDDISCVRNLRQYLEQSPYPENGYCNLVTYQQNDKPDTKGWYRTIGWRGLGAQALMFDQNAAATLLTRQMDDWTLRPKDLKRGHQGIDGAIALKMETFGVHEFVHSPSLVTHVGDESTLGHRQQVMSESFPGEDFDAMDLL